jgi:hypothetical protein
MERKKGAKTGGMKDSTRKERERKEVKITRRRVNKRSN